MLDGKAARRRGRSERRQVVARAVWAVPYIAEVLEPRVLLSAAAWQPLTGPWGSDYDGTFDAVAIDPANPAVCLVASGKMGGGVFKTANGGDTWTPADTGIDRIGLWPFPQQYPSITKIEFAPSNPDVLYLTTATDPTELDPLGDGDVYRSGDGGSSWQKVDGTTNWLGVPQVQDSIFSLAVSPTDPNTVLVGATGQGVLKTTDGGAHWSTIHAAANAPEVDYFNAVSFAPLDSNTLYISEIGSFQGSIPIPDGLDENGKVRTNDVNFTGVLPSGPFKSLDGGATWQTLSLPKVPSVLDPTHSLRVFAPLITDLAIDPSSGDIYAATSAYQTPLLGGADNGGILVSQDGGANWSRVNSSVIGDLSERPILNLAIQSCPGFRDQVIASAGSLSATVLTNINANGYWDAFPALSGPPWISAIGVAGTRVLAVTSAGVFAIDGSVPSHPTVDDFAVTPTTLTYGTPVQIQWTVSDSNGPGLERVELWRTSNTGSWGNSPIQTLNVSGNGEASGTFVDRPPEGTWYYGIHVVDVNGAYRTEHDAGLFPKSVTVASSPDGAKLLSQAIAANTQIAAGQDFTQSWTLQNTGTSTWTTGSKGYTLDRVPFNGTDPLGAGRQYVTLNNVVGPNSQYTFSVSLIAPTVPGTYEEDWQMYGADSSGGLGTSFGPVVSVRIVVPGASPTNYPPGIGVVTRSGTQSGDVTINYSLFDQESDPCGIQVQYSPNGGTSWYTATQGSGGSGTSGLTSLPGGAPHTYVWASGSDIGSTNNSDIEIRITPTDPGGTGSPGATGTFAISNAAATAPTMTLSDAGVAEGSSGTTGCVFAVVLSAAAAQNVTVQYATADGTATVADNDYQSASGTLTIPMGQTSGNITVRVVGDTKYEDDEYFEVNLSNPSGATLLRSQGAGTILNDDQAGIAEVAVKGWFGASAHVIVCNETNPDPGNGTYFGTVPQNSTPPTRTYTVENCGTIPLTVGPPTLPPGFTIIEPLDGLIAPGGSDDFTVQMSTSAVGTPRGNISFTDNDGDGGDGIENPFSFAISGTITYAGAAATTTVLTASPSSGAYGHPVTLTAAVGVVPPGSGTPTGGTVTFMTGTTPLGSATLSQGTAVFTSTSLPAGLQSVTAIYSGDGSNFGTSSSSIGSNLIISTAAGNGGATYVPDGAQATATSFWNGRNSPGAPV